MDSGQKQRTKYRTGPSSVPRLLLAMFISAVALAAAYHKYCPALEAIAGAGAVAARRLSIKSISTNTLGTLDGLTAILSSHLPSALIRSREPSIRHLTIEL
jgi:hypothetical protein